MGQRCQQTFGENENVLRLCLQIRSTRWSDKDVSCKTQCSGGRHQAMLSTRWGRLPRSSFFLIIVNNNSINVNNNKIMPSTCWGGCSGGSFFLTCALGLVDNNIDLKPWHPFAFSNGTFSYMVAVQNARCTIISYCICRSPRGFMKILMPLLEDD